jgi:hypothetical protein
MTTGKKQAHFTVSVRASRLGSSSSALALQPPAPAPAIRCTTLMWTRDGFE